MNYQPVIGLEIHIQLKTQTKMFCSCPTDTWEAEPNSRTCPICLGLPGAIPTINEMAVDQVVKTAQALNCQINKETFFERKNYFYPDLPKGFQITQHRRPIGIEGFVELSNAKKIGIFDVHLEEDTGKSLHSMDGTLLDFNKSGIPLMEIVSKPDLQSADEALEYSKKIYQLVRWIEVSDCDLEKGQMRLELNISMRSEKSAELPDYKVEVKNINSFKFLKTAVEFEIKRQQKIFDKNGLPVQENRGFDDVLGITVAQREKEEAQDYRYFPEPDLPPLRLQTKPLVEILPQEAFNKLLKSLRLPLAMADQLTREKTVYLFFEELLKEGMGPVEAGNIIINRPEVLQWSPKEITQNSKLKTQNLIKDDTIINDIVEKVLASNPKVVADYKAGKEEAIKFLMGQVMKESKGQADPQLASQKLQEFLKGWGG